MQSTAGESRAMAAPTCFWHSRPSALSNNYRDASVKSLFSSYARDSCLHENTNIPPPRPTTCKLRCCQWNINYLSHASSSTMNEHQAAKEIVKVLRQVDSDVIVLNEFCVNEFCVSKELLGRRLEQDGYRVYVSRCGFPTAVATRLHVENVSLLDLDPYRSAVRLDLICKDKSSVRLYGTHLEVSDCNHGEYRRREIEALLSHDKESSSPPADFTIIVGDFNQQREEDYTTDEWKAICANKLRRDSPTNDGVSSRLEMAGFFCTYDVLVDHSALTNWQQTDPPPSTHWTGTIVDYSYGRGKGLSVDALYVSPSDLSDHRLIVTDYAWTERDSNSCVRATEQN